MKTLLSTLMMVIAMALPAAADPSLPHAKSEFLCITPTERLFRMNVARLNPLYSQPNPEAFAKIMDWLNTPRLKAKLWALEADKILIGAITWSDGSKGFGFALFKDGCMVPGGRGQMSIDDFGNAMDSIGVEPKDLILEVTP